MSDYSYGTLNVPVLLGPQCFPTTSPDPPTVWVQDLIGSNLNAQNPFHGRVPDIGMPVFSAEDYEYVYYLLI